MEIRHQKRMPNKLIIAVDFDGTLCEHVFPDIGKPEQETIDMLISLRTIGNKLILWTCREGEHLQQAVNWCALQGLEFDAVNENVSSEFSNFTGARRKIYAHVYLDDKAMHPETFIDVFKTILKELNETPKAV